METLQIKPTGKTLGITCSKGQIEITGCSICNDPKAFFQPVYKWVKDYCKNPDAKTTVSCKIEYIDSASLKNIFELLKLLLQSEPDKTELAINWYIDYEDPELKEVGEILESKLKKKFTYI